MNSFIITAAVNASNANRTTVGRKAQAAQDRLILGAFQRAQDANDRAERARGVPPRPLFWAASAARAAEEAGLEVEAAVLWSWAEVCAEAEEDGLWDRWEREPLSSSAQDRLQARDRDRTNARSRFRAKRGVHYLRCRP
jgi:hypothetical protein